DVSPPGRGARLAAAAGCLRRRRCLGRRYFEERRQRMITTITATTSRVGTSRLPTAPPAVFTRSTGSASAISILRTPPSAEPFPVAGASVGGGAVATAAPGASGAGASLPAAGACPLPPVLAPPASSLSTFSS